MALSEKFARELSLSARREGRRLFERGDVSIDEHAADQVMAIVQAGRPYDVTLVRQKGAVRYACDCPIYHSTAEPCKHVWATLLSAESRGLTGQWETTRRLDFLPESDEADENESDLTADGMRAAIRARPQTRGARARRRSRSIEWRQSLASLRGAMTSDEPVGEPWDPGREPVYVIDMPRTVAGSGLVVEINQRERKKDGGWGRLKKLTIGPNEIAALPDARDREIVSLLRGARSARETFSSYYYSAYGYMDGGNSFRLGEAVQEPLVRRMCETGRCFTRRNPESEPEPLAWDDAGPWELWVVARRDEELARYVLIGELRRGEDRMTLADPMMMIEGGLVFTAGRVCRLDERGAFPWIVLFREREQVTVPAADREELLSQLLSMPRLPRLDLPDDLRVEEVRLQPQPRLRVSRGRESKYDDRLRGEVSFDYDGRIVAEDEPGRAIYQPERRRLIVRDPTFEAEAMARVRALGFKRRTGYYDERPIWLIAATQLPAAIRKLTSEKWHVEADGRLYRQAGEISIEITSGIDWFELHGSTDFDGQSVRLPELLAALRRGEKTVRLGDGTFGVLPEDWLAKYGMLAEMGSTEEDHIRFGRAQVGVLDALLASQPQATCDVVFEEARRRMREFSGVRATEPPAGFVGTLRPYQKDGLGWMGFLRDFQFGGCLADDMGLGKTVQVLAVLESRRELRAAVRTNGNGRHASESDESAPGPSIVVAPRSLIFNWKEEAARFAPALKVLDHTGIGRARSAESFGRYDLILTTYGTLRNDATFLKDVPFDYFVADEAQAIKNSSSESAKAVRVMRGRHRLALSGTPVQNHLGELWSLFDFLNPGMLGTSRAFQATTGATRAIEPQARELLSRALRPFILRRTKGQVAKELPERVEQTIRCELDARQRKLYDDLKEHYRRSLMTGIAERGMKRVKIQILEALLRLRQAACHPGLIDKTMGDQGSAKLDSLLAQISEVVQEGHKILVFSQFTSFLAIVRKRLDAEKTVYEYLDGRTRDRAAAVERFQTDPECKLFLISLKAGGVGLNLTAAEYVFLLDPWWNPAVEAQAIDRAHRIGQTRQVFAYRLIAADTVEEKVLQLQQSKRDLADAIIGADNSLISRLGREDLELLLS